MTQGPLDTARRAALLTGAAGIMFAATSRASSDGDTGTQDPAQHLMRLLEDPAARARVRTKIVGSIAPETVYTFCRLHIYLWRNDGNLQPLYTLQNLSAATWRALPNGHYAATQREAGVYTQFDTDELLEQWRNPVTDDVREPFHFRGGPISIEIGPDGVITGAGATLKPRSMRLDVLGDTVLLPTESAFSFPTPFKEQEWPKEAGDPTYYWDSHYLFAARIAEILDESVSFARSVVQYQNLISFHPWMGMGKTPGRTYGKALGVKLGALAELPVAVGALFEAKTPEIFDLSTWQPTREFGDYMQQWKPGA